jgi:hypothetical protein
MEENFSPAEQSKSNTPVPSRANLLQFFFALIVLLLLLGILNYFNILSISKAFPNQLGWLPKQQTQIKNVAPTSILFRLCKAFPENYGKVNCQKAVETATADTKGTVMGIAVGPQEINQSLQKTLKISKTQTVWLIEIELEKPYVSPNKNLVKSLLVQIPVDGTKAIYRKPINL